jgi:hypothetical protein
MTLSQRRKNELAFDPLPGAGWLAALPTLVAGRRRLRAGVHRVCMVHLFALILALGPSLTVLGPGALAPADPLVLETVEVKRVRYGWGLDSFASPAHIRLAVESCEHLGRRGVVVTEGEVYRAYIVDCQQRDEVPRMSEIGLIADIAPQWQIRGQVVIVLWP